MDNRYDKEMVAVYCAHMARSFEAFMGHALVDTGPEGLMDALDNAPFVIVAHAGEKDPTFFFANKMALKLWNMPRDEFIGMRSSYSADPAQRAEREELLERGRQQGIITDYSGIRAAKGGQKFMIEDVVLWNITDDAGHYIGQAATFSKWRFLEPQLRPEHDMR